MSKKWYTNGHNFLSCHLAETRNVHLLPIEEKNNTISKSAFPQRAGDWRPPAPLRSLGVRAEQGEKSSV